MLRTQAYYNANETRPYPVDDAATVRSDKGQLLPANILADLNLRFPSNVAAAAYVSAVTVTPTIVTVVILGTNNVPLAAVSLPQPITRYRHYPLQPLSPGVGGWIVFGGGVANPFSGRFSTPAQSQLAARVSRSYAPLPIRSLGTLDNNAALQGVVELVSGNDIALSVQQREMPIHGDPLNTVLRNVIVFSLADTANVSSGRNVFAVYSGGCSGRPESQTCGDPQPIEFINTVGPDCAGQVTIELQGCAIPTQIVSGGNGVLLDCGLGLSEACPTRHDLPTADGTLPNDFKNLCSDYSDIVPISETSSEGSPTPDYTDISEGSGPVGLPYLERFDIPAGTTLFTPVPAYSGGNNWIYVGGDSLYEPQAKTAPIPNGTIALPGPYWSVGIQTSSGAAGVNVGYFDLTGGAWSILNKQFVTAISLDDAPGASHNAGVLVNYRYNAAHPTQSTYYLVELDWDRKQLRLSHFDGALLSTLETVTFAALALRTWYLVNISVRSDVVETSGAWLDVTVSTGGPYTTSATLGPTFVEDFLPATGTFGFETNRSYAYFSFARVDHEV